MKGKIYYNLIQNNKWLKYNPKLTKIVVSEEVLVLCLKNGRNQDFLISEIVKIHLEISKSKWLTNLIAFILISIVLLISSHDYIWLITIFLYAMLFFFTLKTFTNQRFKFKLIVKVSNQEIHQFGFKYDIKNNVIDSISKIKNQIKL